MTKTKALLPPVILLTIALLMASSFFDLARDALGDTGYNILYQVWAFKLWPASVAYLAIFITLFFVCWKKGIEWGAEKYLWVVGALLSIFTLVVYTYGSIAPTLPASNSSQIFAYWPQAFYTLMTSLISQPITLVLVWSMLIRFSSIKEGLSYFILFGFIYSAISALTRIFVLSQVKIAFSNPFITASLLGVAAIGISIFVLRLGLKRVALLKETPNPRPSMKFGQFPIVLSGLFLAIPQFISGVANSFFKLQTQGAYPARQDYLAKLAQSASYKSYLAILFGICFVILGMKLIRSKNGFSKCLIVNGVVISLSSLLFFILFSYSPDERIYSIFSPLLNMSLAILAVPLLQLIYLRLKKEERLSMQLAVQILIVPILIRLVLFLMGTMRAFGMDFARGYATLGIVSALGFGLVTFFLLRKMSGKHKLEA